MKKIYLDPRTQNPLIGNSDATLWLNNFKFLSILGKVYSTVVQDAHAERQRQMKPILLVATPAFGSHVHTGYYNSMMNLQNLCKKENIALFTFTPGSYSIISKARNACVAAFLCNPNATHLMFIDADIEFEPKDVVKLLRHNKPLICGAYTMKQIEWGKAVGIALKMQEKRNGKIEVHELMERSAYYHTGCVHSHQVNITPILREDGLMHAPGAATGFMMIQRGLIERLIKKHPEKQYFEPRQTGVIKDCFYALFDHYIHPEKKFYMGEDYAFCNSVLALGEDVWIDPDCKLIHHGQMGFHGHLLKQLQPLEA